MNNMLSEKKWINIFLKEKMIQFLTLQILNFFDFFHKKRMLNFLKK